MNCKKCNKPIKENEKFCTSCGAKVEQVKEVKIEKEPKKSKVPFIIGIISIVVIFVGLIIFLVALGLDGKFNKETGTNSNDNNNTVEQSNNTASSNTASGKVNDYKNDKKDNDEKDDSDYTIIGNDEFGYMKAPGKFVTFVDVDGSDTLQYSNGSYIVSMYALKSEHKAKDYADGAYSNALEDSTQTKVTGATVKVGKYTAYQVYSYFTDDNIWLVRWYFDTEDGYYRYIAIEGPEYDDVFKMVDTFSISKIE